MEKILWSKSRLKTFRECPMRYKFHYIDKIPQEEVEALQKGIILHNFFNQFYDNFKTDINSAIVKTTKEMNIPEDFQDKYEIHVESFIDFNKSKKLQTPLLREKKYYDANWMGIIDRVDCIDGKCIVIDYKTSTGTNIKNYLDELLLYAYLVQKNSNLKISQVGIFYTGNNRFITQDVTQEQIQKNFEDLSLEAEVYEDLIAHNEFDYKPGHYCKWCPYQDICKVRNGYKKEDL